MSIWVRKDIFVSDILPQNGQNIQEKDGLDEGYLNPEARKVETPAKKLQDSSLEDFKRQMQEFIAKMNADTVAYESKRIYSEATWLSGGEFFEALGPRRRGSSIVAFASRAQGRRVGGTIGSGR